MSKARELAELGDTLTVDGSGNIDVTGTVTADGLTVDTSTLHVDSTNNRVGIGTTTPATKLEVSDTASKPAVRLEWDANNTDAGEVDRAQLEFSTKNIGGSRRSWGISGYTTSMTSTFNAGLRFDYVGAGVTSEAMRVDASGNVLVGTTASSAKWLSTNGVDMGVEVRPANFGLVMHMPNEAMLINIDNATAFQRFYYRGAVVGNIATNGSSTAYNTTSDYRLKENITPVQGAADIVKAMRPCTYTFKSDGSWHDGFLAHELQELHPRAVTGSKDAMVDEEYEVTPAVLDDEGNVVTEAVMGTRSVPDYQGVDYSKLTPILTAALQEALNKIDALETRLAALEAV